MAGKFLIYCGTICCAILCIFSNSFASIEDMKNVREEYKEVVVFKCVNCHVPENYKLLNAYGKAYKEAGRNVEAIRKIAGQDSDGDGVNNADEIKAGTNPGIKESK